MCWNPQQVPTVPARTRRADLHGAGDFRVHPRARSHVAVMHGAQPMPDDIAARPRQHARVLGANRSGVLRGKFVDAARKLVEVLAELRILRVVPDSRARGHAVQLHPPIELEVGVAAPVLCRPSARFAVEAQQKVCVITHLRPAVCVEQRLAVGRIDVRNAVPIPENFGVPG